MVRLVIAFIGGTAVTIALLLLMNEATKHFKDRDPTRYFGIVDFIPAPEGGLPRPPPAPRAQPERAQLPYDRSGDAALPLDRPSVQDEQPERAVPVPVDPGPAPAPDIDPEGP